jgi:hypothetical protein
MKSLDKKKAEASCDASAHFDCLSEESASDTANRSPEDLEALERERQDCQTKEPVDGILPAESGERALRHGARVLVVHFLFLLSILLFRT